MTAKPVHRSLLHFLIVFAAISPTSCSQPPSHEPDLAVSEQTSHTRSLLIGLSPVDARVVWVSGTDGTVLRTLDGGSSWEVMTVPGADSLQFRDVHGVDRETAYVLSAGSGAASRIYKTTDGGQTWDLQFTNASPHGFFDCMDFWSPQSGFAFSDSHEGAFLIIRTDNGGEDWTRVPPENIPTATDGEGSFAASGRCAMVAGDSTGFIGTGAGSSARILKTEDRGRTWAAYETPIHDGTPTSGISSLSWLDDRNGFAFGLELGGRDSTISNVIETTDGGRSWTTLNPTQLPDVYGGTHIPGRMPPVLVAVGPKGIDYSLDRGQTWTSASKLDHWGVAFVDQSTGWAVGPGGRISRLTLRAAPGK